MLYYAVYAACLAYVCYTMQDYNCGLFAAAIAMWLFIVYAVGIVL